MVSGNYSGEGKCPEETLMKTEPENDPCPRNNTDTSPAHTTTRANREEGHGGPCCKGRFFLQGWC